MRQAVDSSLVLRTSPHNVQEMHLDVVFSSNLCVKCSMLLSPLDGTKVRYHLHKWCVSLCEYSNRRKISTFFVLYQDKRLMLCAPVCSGCCRRNIQFIHVQPKSITALCPGGNLVVINGCRGLACLIFLFLARDFETETPDSRAAFKLTMYHHSAPN